MIENGAWRLLPVFTFIWQSLPGLGDEPGGTGRRRGQISGEKGLSQSVLSAKASHKKLQPFPWCSPSLENNRVSLWPIEPGKRSKKTLSTGRLLVPLKPLRIFSSDVPLLVNEDALNLQPTQAFSLAWVVYSATNYLNKLTRIPSQG